MSYRDDRYWEDPQYDADFGEYNNSEDDLAFDFFSNQQDYIRSRGWDFADLVNSWDEYKASNRFYVFDEFLDAYDKGISSVEDTFRNQLNKAIENVLKPPALRQISEGLWGYLSDYFVDITKGNVSAVNERAGDIENLATNMVMYLISRGVSKATLQNLQIGYFKTDGTFVPDYTLLYQLSYVIKNQLSDMVWSGYSEKYTGDQTGELADYYRRIEELTGGFHWNIRTWSYAKNGNTKDAPASGGWIKSKYGDYYIRKNLF